MILPTGLPLAAKSMKTTGFLEAAAAKARTAMGLRIAVLTTLVKVLENMVGCKSDDRGTKK